MHFLEAPNLEAIPLKAWSGFERRIRVKGLGCRADVCARYDVDFVGHRSFGFAFFHVPPRLLCFLAFKNWPICNVGTMQSESESERRKEVVGSSLPMRRGAIDESVLHPDCSLQKEHRKADFAVETLARNPDQP